MTNFTILLLLSMLVSTTLAFQVLVAKHTSPNRANLLRHHAIKTTGDETTSTIPFFATLQDATDNNISPAAGVAVVTDKTAKSLQDKMSNWEASEEEIKAATLGGMNPGGLGGRKGNDGFDVGLYIAFPFMILGSLLFAFFPLIMDKIDVSSVGPPPMM